MAGGGIDPDNAAVFLDAGASHVIVTSYVFRNGQVDRNALKNDLEGHIQEYLPGYRADINFDNNFSD